MVPDAYMYSSCKNQSSITLLDGGVRTQALALLSTSGCTPILPPDNPVAASAGLSAPQVSLFLRLLPAGEIQEEQPTK